MQIYNEIGYPTTIPIGNPILVPSTDSLGLGLKQEYWHNLRFIAVSLWKERDQVSCYFWVPRRWWFLLHQVMVHVESRLRICGSRFDILPSPFAGWKDVGFLKIISTGLSNFFNGKGNGVRECSSLNQTANYLSQTVRLLGNPNDRVCWVEVRFIWTLPKDISASCNQLDLFNPKSRSLCKSDARVFLQLAHNASIMLCTCIYSIE